MVEGENAQLRPLLTAAGDPVQVVEALVDVRARHRFGALQVVIASSTLLGIAGAQPWRETTSARRRWRNGKPAPSLRR